MGAFASKVLNDGQAAPVAHTFSPVTIAGELALWQDRAPAVALGFLTLSQFLKRPSKESRTYKLTLKVVTPVLEVTAPTTVTGIQPAPTLAYNLIGSVEFVLPERSSLQERKDILAYVKNALAHVDVTNGVQNLETVF